MSGVGSLLTRQQQIAAISARIFGRAFNAEGKRTGERVLRQPIRGPEVVSYYPPEPFSFRELREMYPDMELIDLKEGARLAKIETLRRRGKGAPEKGAGRRASIKKR
ncbi:mitochondral 37S ribosomal protein S27 [Dimargaris cristalligena]|uniref:Small ribosomal subunit protein mS33 n=1 Tax=Dimargaris cristalligena TaxID=215637 RepID=A0A4Q0A2B1_9FUNG|nr:mitochondral 37S ribosomal protein S27 [Dimargaris cristalligena]RKP39310.1 mitochondrial ribosomal subunit S27-domain-containing protein [Dimargaris cristalligena]|eukprot:RKP39310.1 mitochondrial ribosomal subunit S27-domain-containing protein [Dimargaris cristalligena]